MDNQNNKFNGYNPYNTYEGYEIAKQEKQKVESKGSNEQINIKIDKKGKGHEKNKKSGNYGFIGSKSTTKYSNPYDNNAYGNFSSQSKKEKKTNKKELKKKSSNGTDSNTPSDIDVTQAAAVPVVIYPQQLTTVPTVYYTTPVGTPVGTPVAIQYVNSPTIGYQDGSNSSSTELTKEKRESKRMISYYADKENATESIIKSDDKEKELEEIMNELGMKPKDKEPKDLKSRLLRNQLFIFVSLLILFVIAIVLFLVWPRLPEIVVTEFELQPDGIQYKLPMNIEYRDSYIDLANVTSSDIDSFVQFNMIVHFDVKNNNFIPYKFNSLFIEYVLKSESLSNNVLLGDSYVDSISFGPRKNALMTITTSLKYAARNMKNDNTFRFILDRCGITSPGSDMDIEYKVNMKIPVVSIIYRPSYTKTTQFRCPFLNDDKLKIKEKKKDEDEDENKDEDKDEDKDEKKSSKD